MLIKTVAAGICRTDVHLFDGSLTPGYPRVSGHEFSGTVAAVGDGVDGFVPGDRVTADPNIACGSCIFCQRNEANQCLDHEAIGITRDGAFAEYVLAPQANVFSIGSIPFPEAAMIEPLACVVWGLKRVHVQPGDSVRVLGAGTIGCLLTMALRASGAGTIVVTDTLPWRLDRAAEVGATEVVLADERQQGRLAALEPHGFDIVVDATGVASVLEQSIRYARPRGRVWVFGVMPPEATVQVSPFEIFRKDLTIIGTHAVNRTFPEAVAWVASGLPVGRLITDQFSLAEYGSAIALASGGGDCLKVQFAF